MTALGNNLTTADKTFRKKRKRYYDFKNLQLIEKLVTRHFQNFR